MDNGNQNHLQRLARRAWYIVFILALGFFIVSLPAYFVGGLTPLGLDLSSRFTPNTHPFIISMNFLAGVISISIVLLSFFMALMLFRHRPDDRMALFLSYFLLAYAIFAAGPSEAILIFLSENSRIFIQFVSLLFTLPMSVLLLSLFPDGRFVPGWSRWLFIFSFFVLFLMITVAAVGYSLLLLLLFSMLYAQVFRYRHISTRQQKQQTKWFVYGFGLLFVFMLISSIFRELLIRLPPGSIYPYWGALSGLLYFIALLIIPISLTISMMRYRLYDIDFIINRTLVYGVMTAIVVFVYVLTVGLTAVAFQANSDLVGLIMATLFVVFLVRPLQGVLQRAADLVIPISKPHSGHSSPAGAAGQSKPATEAGDQQYEPEGYLAAGWRRLLHGVWYLAAAVSLVIFIVSIPGSISLIPTGFFEERFTVNPAPVVLTFNLLFVIFSIASVLVSLYLAVLIFRRKSKERFGLLLSFYLLAHGILGSGPLEMLEPYIPGIARLNYGVLLPLVVFPILYSLLLVFPDGRLVPGWTRWGMAGIFLAAPLFSFLTLSITIDQPDYSNPLILAAIILTAVLSIALIFILFFAQRHRYMHIYSYIQRQQTKWILYGIGLWFTILCIGSIFWMYSFSLSPGTPFPWWMAATQALWGFSTVIFPVTLAVSVLRYQLFDIDILINRTLVYGALTAAIMAVYVMAVGYFGNVLQQLDSVFIAFLVTGLVALLFQPLRESLQRFINRLMYGERDDPMSVLKKMGSHLEDMVRPDQALAGIVKTAAQALKLPHVAIVTTHNNQLEISAQYGESSNEQIEIPMVYQGENIGYLEIAKRGSNEDFSAKEITLLENIARQASSTVASVRLMEDLKRSRQRLVTAREEERRRLRRDLHDGLGASLAALHLQTGAIKRAIENDPNLAAAMVEEVRSELHEAIADIRRVAYELRPPALDELGLAAALRAQAAQYNKLKVSGKNETRSRAETDGYLDVQVEAPKVLPSLPAAVEVATYRIVQEALTNVLKHANAHRCVVRLEIADGFCVEILDDGIGISENQSWGIGLTSMCERAYELGGTCVIEPGADSGTRVFASFPILQEKSK